MNAVTVEGQVAPPLPPPGGVRATPAQALVIGGSLLAPVDLAVVRGLMVYDAVILVALVLLLRERHLRLPPAAYLLCAAAFTLAAAVSAFRATYPLEALTQLAQYAFILFVQVPVVLTTVRTRRAVLASLAFLASGALLAILHAHITRETQGADRVVVFFSENPNRLGYPTAFLLPFLILFAVQLWRHARALTPGTRAVAWLGCAVGLYLSLWALVASASRSSLLGTVVALTVAVVLVPGGGVGRIVRRAAALAGVLGATWFVLAAAGALPATLTERIQRSFQPEERSALVGDREHLASAGLRAFVDSPFVGTGLDNFRHVATDYNLAATAQAPHNLWVQLLAQVGAIGAVGFAALLVWWFRRMLRAYGHAASPLDRRVVWTLVAAMSGTLTILMVAPEMLDRHYWLMVALGLAVADGVHRHHVPRKEAAP